MGRRLPFVALGLVGALLLAQMPWVIVVLVQLHGSHVTITTRCDGQVVIVFSHAATESEPDQSHADHVVTFSEGEDYPRRATSNSLRLFCPSVGTTSPLLSASASGSGAALPPTRLPTHSPPSPTLLQTVVLTV